MTNEELLGRLLDRVASSRGSQLVDGEPQWIVGHPTICPYRFRFGLLSGHVTLVVFDAKTGDRLLPTQDGRSIVFSPEQAETVLEVFMTSELLRAEKLTAPT